MITNIHCSKLARPMVCAGSLFFTDLPEDPPNDAAKEGTAAGEYLERLLTAGGAAATHARNGVPFDVDMKFYGATTCKEIKDAAKGEINCEVPINWQTPSGIWINGKYDASYEGHDGALHVDDYKYGFGLVEVEENWQILGYAIGEVIRRNKAYNEIVLTIRQPRAHHECGPVRSWRIGYSELLARKEQIETRMQQIVDGEKSLVSCTHCKYCRAAAFCPAFNKAYHRGVDLVHDFIQDTLDETELSFQLDLVNRIEDLVKTRRSSLELLAITRIKDGKLIPDYALDQKLANRTWQGGIDPAAIKMLTGKDVTRTEMMSPAQAEKIGVPQDLIDKITERKMLGMKLKKVDTGKLGDRIFGKPQQLRGE